MLLDAFLLNTQHYKVRIKNKWRNPGKGIAPSPTRRYCSYWKGSLQVTLDNGWPTCIYIYIYILGWVINNLHFSNIQYVMLSEFKNNKSAKETAKKICRVWPMCHYWPRCPKMVFKVSFWRYITEKWIETNTFTRTWSRCFNLFGGIRDKVLENLHLTSTDFNPQSSTTWKR